MQATRREIINILKRRAGATVDDLARSLSLSPMCIRQHLALLERDGLVSPREVRRRTGRPHYFYTLTEKADGLFPKSYDKLALGLLEELKGVEGPERTADLLRRLGDRLGAEHAQSLVGKTFEERLSSAVTMLGNGQSLGDWRKDEEGYLLREYDCPFSRISARHQEVCGLHERMLTRVLGVEVRRVEHLVVGDARCTYRVEPPTAAV